MQTQHAYKAHGQQAILRFCQLGFQYSQGWRGYLVLLECIRLFTCSAVCHHVHSETLVVAESVLLQQLEKSKYYLNVWSA